MTNVERRTSNAEHRTEGAEGSAVDVRRSALEVPRSEPDQLPLDFAAAAAAAAERMAAARGDLWRLAESLSEGDRIGKLSEAAARIGAGTRLTALLLATARSAGADSRAVVALSHRTLAEELGCSERTARRVAAAARNCRLLRMLPATDDWGNPWGPNSYQIDWPEVLTACAEQAKPPGVRAAKNGHPPAKNGHPPAKNGHPPANAEASISPACAGAVPASFLLSEEKNSGPVPVPDPGRVKSSEEPALLAEARLRPIEPMPVGSQIADGIFAPLGRSSLEDPRKMLEWTRRQLSAEWPATGGTEADALLVLATALHAVDPPRGKHVRNPVGWFTWAVRQRDARLVRGQLRAAREQLDQLLDAWGDALLRGPWPVPPGYVPPKPEGSKG